MPRTEARDGTRFYDLDGGRHYISVTSVLKVIGKPALITWAANEERKLVTQSAADLYLDLVKCAPMSRPGYLTTLEARIGKEKAHVKELARAGEIGTQAHRLIEWNLRRALGQKVGPEPRVTDKASWAFMAFQDWAGAHKFKALLIEQTVFSDVHKYAGTMDLLAEIDGVPKLIDFKTGKSIYWEALLQSVAYQVALTEMGHVKPEGGIIVRLPKNETDPKFEVKDVPPVADLFPVFLAAKALWEPWYAEEQARLAEWKAKRDAEKEEAPA